MKKTLNRFLIALQFLTIFPVKIKASLSEPDYGKSILWFPVVGCMVGVFLGLILFILWPLPYIVRVAIVLVASVIITGAIHLDGLADTADGFYAGRYDRAHILEVMRDSHIGVMGVLALASVLLLKFSFMFSLQEVVLYKVLVLMSIFSRWAQGLACFAANYARKEGKARLFMKYSDKTSVITGALITAVSFVVLMGVKGVIIFTLSSGIVYSFIAYVKRRIKGMTGDTIGATNEIAELSVLFIALMLFG